MATDADTNRRSRPQSDVVAYEPTTAPEIMPQTPTRYDRPIALDRPVVASEPQDPHLPWPHLDSDPAITAGHRMYRWPAAQAEPVTLDQPSSKVPAPHIRSAVRTQVTSPRATAPQKPMRHDPPAAFERPAATPEHAYPPPWSDLDSSPAITAGDRIDLWPALPDEAVTVSRPSTQVSGTETRSAAQPRATGPRPTASQTPTPRNPPPAFDRRAAAPEPPYPQPAWPDLDSSPAVATSDTTDRWPSLPTEPMTPDGLAVARTLARRERRRRVDLEQRGVAWTG